MALKATIYKAELDISDVDRGYYGTHSLTLARHPSETEERLMIRLLAFVMYAAPGLDFGRGISTDDEPDLWRRDDGGTIVEWIDLGLPDERRLRRAAGRSERQVLVAYGDRALDAWWPRHADAMARLSKLTVWVLTDALVAELATLASRQMSLQCTVTDGDYAFSDGTGYVVVHPERRIG